MWMRLLGILIGLIIMYAGLLVADSTVPYGSWWLHFMLPWSIIAIGAGLVLAIVWAPLPNPDPYRRK